VARSRRKKPSGAGTPGKRTSGAGGTGGGSVVSSSAILYDDPGDRRNLIVEGTVDARVALHAHDVSISTTGRIQGDLHGTRIRVEGEVVGNLFGEEEVVIHGSASVLGKITAPSVIVEEGARFKGKIEMRRASGVVTPAIGAEKLAVVMYDHGARTAVTSAEEHRVAIRVAKRLLVEYSDEGPPIEAKIDDLSEAGMYIGTSHALPAGSALRFGLSLPDTEDSTPVRGSAVVAWSHPTGMGVEFRELSDSGRERIRYFVAAVLLDQPSES
jgi:cytoskeletal protein CcmA (bactofilin family)